MLGYILYIFPPSWTSFLPHPPPSHPSRSPQSTKQLPMLYSSFSLVIFFTDGSIYIGEGNGTPLQYSCLENPMDGGAWWAAVHGVSKSRTWLSDLTFTFHFHALEKEMAAHSSVLAWRIPGMGEPGGLLSMGSHRVGHDWSDLAAAAAAVYICQSESPNSFHPPLPLLRPYIHSMSASLFLLCK